MKRLTMRLLVALVVLGMATQAVAQDGTPLAFEGRITLGKAGGSQAISWRPTAAMILDLGIIDLGLAVTDDGQWDSTQEVEFFIPIELYAWEWSEGTRALIFETYVGTDIAQGTTLESRSLTLGMMYSSTRLKGLLPLIRGQVRNYDYVSGDGDKTSLTDWAVQVGFRKKF